MNLPSGFYLTRTTLEQSGITFPIGARLFFDARTANWLCEQGVIECGNDHGKAQQAAAAAPIVTTRERLSRVGGCGACGRW